MCIYRKENKGSYIEPRAFSLVVEAKKEERGKKEKKGKGGGQKEGGKREIERDGFQSLLEARCLLTPVLVASRASPYWREI